jgi:general secretion pathway protein A
MISAPLDERHSRRSFADDPQFIASLSALEQGLTHTENLDTIAPAAPPSETLESLSEAMWSEVAAQWDALAPIDPPRTRRWRDLVAPPVRVETPFAPAPDLRFLYHSAEHDRALNELASSVTRGEPVVVLTGERGAGKTTLCRALVDQLDRRTMVSFVAAAASVDDLLKRLLVDFGVISSDETARQLGSASRDDLLRALGEFFSSLTVLQASALVIVDDAHLLTPEVWAELRAICDTDGDRRLLQMLLVGEPALNRLLRRGDVRTLERRVAFRVELGSLRREEIHAYVPHRLAVAGKADQVRFDEGALRHVFSLSGGVPGAVNSICDRALTLALRASSNRIDAELAAQAADEIGFDAPLGSSWRDRAVVAVFVIVMLIAGAAGAGLVFREPLTRAVARWHGVDPSTSPTSR